MTWYRVVAPPPGPCAGFCVGPDGRVTDGAPILRWMRGKPLAEVLRWCERKGWRCQKLERVGSA